jgi:Zn-dependent M28 family amino/carboxypeptidase
MSSVKTEASALHGTLAHGSSPRATVCCHPYRNWTHRIATTRAMLNFDMIGRDEAPTPQTDGLIDIPKETSNRLNLIGAKYSPDYKRVVVAQNAAVGLLLDDRFDHESALNIFFRSDQFPFVLKNVPALWWFTGFHPDLPVLGLPR